MRKRLVFLLLPTIFTAFAALAQAPRLVIPIGHTNRVTSVAFSPDGQQVLTGSWDGTAKLWDLSGREIQSFSGHTSGVGSVAFSPDGQQVLTGSFDNTVKLWRVSGGAPLTYQHTSHVNSVAFSPDGQQVLTGSGDGTVRLWNVSGSLIKSFSAHASELSSVAFSPDGKNVLTGSWDGNAKLWDLSGSLIKTFSGASSIVSSVAFSPDGQKVLTGSGDGMAKLWNVSGGAPLLMEHISYINSVAFSPDGQTVLTGSRDGVVKLWNVSGSPIKSFPAHTSVVSSVAFSPDGQSVLTGSWDKEAKLWNLSGSEMQSFRGHAFPVLSAAFSPDGQQIIAGSRDGTAKLWNLPGRAIQSFKGHTSGVNSVAFSADGQQVLTGSADSTAKLWSLAGIETKNFRHSGPVLSVAFSAQGQQVLTGSADSTAKLWNLAGIETKNFRHDGQVLSVAFSPNGQQVLTGSTDNMAKLWNLKGSDTPAIMAHASAISSAAFSPDGKKILTGSFDKTAKLWALPVSLVQTFSWHTDAVTSVAFSPDGQQVLTGSGDRTAKRRSLSNPADTLTFRGHTSFVRSVVFSPDGQKVLTGSEDNSAKLWDAKTGICLATLIALDSSEWAVTTPSGLFDASPGAMNLMYFLQGLEVIELEQLKERYYEPGLLSKLMGFSNEPLRSVAAFEAIAMYPLIQLRLDSAKHQLHIALQPRDGGMGQLSVFVNGKEIIEDALRGAGPGRSRDTVVVLDLEPFARYFLSDTLNTVAVRAYNRENWLRSPLHTVTYRPEFVSAKGGPGEPTSPTSFRRKRNPALHLLLVGVHDYAGTTLDLKYTAKDAEDMAKALQQSGAQLFQADSVFVHLLSTTPGQKPPTKANIQAAFEAITARAKAEDILLAYFSGHGVNYGEAEKSQFYFLTMETGSFDLSDPGIRAARAISSDELTRWIKLVPAQKQVLIVDACNSGKMVEDMGAGGKSLTASQIRAFDRMKDRTGLFILSGSAANQKSFEASKYRQSLLTYSLLEAMQGAALNDRDIDVIRLFDQARTRVRELAAELSLVQEPVPNYPRNAGTIFIGRVNENVNIELARAGAVFVGSVFQDEAQFNDPLNLADAVNSYLREEDAAGAGFLFFDLKNIPDAYSIKGRYVMQGDAVTVRARLFKGNAVVGAEFSLKGKKSALSELVEAIVGKVAGMVK